ncbi:MAG: LysE family translocator [Alphaproteobacteria bacterium]
MISFALAVVFLILTPGPGVLTTAGFGAAYGFRRSLAYVVGLFIGTNLVMLAVISGMAAVLLSVPGLRTVLMLASLAFLLYLAATIAFAGARIAFIAATSAPGVLGGVLLQIVNPKAYAVNTALITGFNYAPDNLPFEIATKIIIASAIWIPIHLLWLWAGVRLHALNLSPRRQRIINIGMAAALLMVVGLSVTSLLTPPS